MRMPLLVLVLLTLVGCTSSPNQSPQQLTKEALALSSPASSEDELHQALLLLDSAIELETDYLPARKQRINILVRLGEMDATVEEARTVSGLSGSPQDYFFYCMAREASKPDWNGRDECYLEAGRRYESAFDEPANDVNYVLALKLAESANFSAVAVQFLEGLTSDASRELFEPLLLESDRQQIINDLFYSSY